MAKFSVDNIFSNGKKQKKKIFFFFVFRILNHDNYLCAPKHRWWRGEAAAFGISSRAREAGLAQRIWGDMFPHHRFFDDNFEERRKRKQQQEPEERMGPESLLAMAALGCLLHATSAVVFLRERRRRRRDRLTGIVVPIC